MWVRSNSEYYVDFSIAKRRRQRGVGGHGKRSRRNREGREGRPVFFTANGKVP